MQAGFASFPPELVLEVAEHVDQANLCSLIGVARPLYFLLWPILYRRETAKRNPDGFIRCIRTSPPGAVGKFIAAGVDVNVPVHMGKDIQDFTGYTYPLATAVLRGHREIVDLLLRNGADVEAQIVGFPCHSVWADGYHPWAGIFPNTPLSVAVSVGHDDIAVELVRHMANPNSIITIGGPVHYTHLEQAVLCLRPKVVRQLLKQGANPNQQRHSQPGAVLDHLLDNVNLQYWVSSMPDGEDLFTGVVMMLLQYGADPFVPRACVHGMMRSYFKGDRCVEGCPLTPCSIAANLPYPQVRQHFRELEHRQFCKRPACRESRDQYATKSEDIPGHCGGYY